MEHDIGKTEQSAAEIPSCHTSLQDVKSGIPNSETNDMVSIASLHERTLTGILDISKVLTGTSGLEVTLAKVVDLLRSFVQMRHGTIRLFEGDGVQNVAVDGGWSEGGHEHSRICLPRNAIERIVTTDKPLVIENIAAHSHFSAADREVLGATSTKAVSFIGVPIRVDANVVGTLTIDRVLEDGSSFRPECDVRLLTLIANMVGQTVKSHGSFACDGERTLAKEHRLQKQFTDLKHREREHDKVRVGGMIGDSPALRALTEKIAVVAKTRTTVLVRGESGTGKELVAKAIHELSPRAKRPFIKLNCAALPETVLESELFGHEKGAFTSAFNSRKGRFELADKGTLFLDEIGEISASFQAKLLRVLQEQEFERVGGNQTIKVDVRVIAATNKNLEEAVARNEFRADLYYRINVVPLFLPALRERRNDIPLLAAKFLKTFNEENSRKLAFDAGAIEVLMSCGFPGNIRELENCVNRTAIFAPGPLIGRNDLCCSNGQCFSAALWRRSGSCTAPPQSGGTGGVAARPTPPVEGSGSAAVATPPGLNGHAPLGRAPSAYLNGPRITDAERVIEAMERCGWVQAKAARLLGLTPRQIGYVLKKYGIEVKRL